MNNTQHPSWQTPNPGENPYGYGGQPGPYPAPQPPQPPRRKGMSKAGKWFLGITCGLILVVGSCTSMVIDGAVEAGDKAPVISTDTPSAKASARTPAPLPMRTKPVEQAPSFLPEDGTLEVGPDVKPGTYKTTVPADSIGCYWARLRNTSGEMAGIIANGVAQPGSRVTITIKATDAAVELRGCGRAWKRAR